MFLVQLAVFDLFSRENVSVSLNFEHDDISSSFVLQGILVYMFRELMGYCVAAISSSEHYSLALQHTTTATFVILNFWSGNVLHRVCLGSAPRGMLLPRKILSLVSSFLSLFDTVPTCISLIDIGEKLSECSAPSLPGKQQPTVICTFGIEEFEKSLAMPTAQIIERHDFRTIIDFLLMKLRTALDREWLRKIPLLHKVV